MMKRVLLVDDEEMMVSVISATLGNDPAYELLIARDGEEAIEQARKFKPDLVLLDVMLPKQDGFMVCRAIKKNPETAHTVVVMLSAMAQEADLQKGVSAGANDYITKPFSPIDLISKVHEVLAHKSRVGQHVMLRNGRSGTVLGSVSLSPLEIDEPGYHVRMDDGGSATVRASEIDDSLAA